MRMEFTRREIDSNDIRLVKRRGTETSSTVAARAQEPAQVQNGTESLVSDVTSP